MPPGRQDSRGCDEVTSDNKINNHDGFLDQNRDVISGIAQVTVANRRHQDVANQDPEPPAVHVLMEVPPDREEESMEIEPRHSSSLDDHTYRVLPFRVGDKDEVIDLLDEIERYQQKLVSGAILESHLQGIVHGVFLKCVVQSRKVNVSRRGCYACDRQYEKVRSLGKGGSAVVWLCHDIKSQFNMARKMINIRKFRRQEVEVLLELSGGGGEGPQYIPQLYGIHLEDDFVNVWMEYVEILWLNVQPNTDDTYMLLKQALAGLEYLHKSGFVHTDIKPHNLGFNKKREQVAILDFGSVNKLGESGSLEGDTTPEYCAPERFSPRPQYHDRLDVWSLACCVIYLLSRQHPWSDVSNGDEAKRHEVYPRVRHCTTDEVMAYLPKKYHNSNLGQLLRHMLETDPARRCTAAQALAYTKYKDNANQQHRSLLQQQQQQHQQQQLQQQQHQQQLQQHQQQLQQQQQHQQQLQQQHQQQLQQQEQQQQQLQQLQQQQLLQQQQQQNIQEMIENNVERLRKLNYPENYITQLLTSGFNNTNFVQLLSDFVKMKEREHQEQNLELNRQAENIIHQQNNTAQQPQAACPVMYPVIPQNVSPQQFGALMQEKLQALVNQRADEQPITANQVNPQQAVVNPGLVQVNPQQAVVNPGLVQVNPQQAVVNPGLVQVNPQQAVVNPGLVQVNPQQAVVNPGLVQVNPQQAVVNLGLVQVNPQPAVVNPGLAQVNPQQAVVNPVQANFGPVPDFDILGM